MNKQLATALLFAVVAMMLLSMPATAADQLPDPDGKSADMTKPVQVYILMGQSNMLNFGKIKGGDGSLEHAVKEKGLYPYLVDDTGARQHTYARCPAVVLNEVRKRAGPEAHVSVVCRPQAVEIINRWRHNRRRRVLDQAATQRHPAAWQRWL